MEIDIVKPHVIVHGNNGQGKSSLLEALHYSCYLRSFRTHLNREITTIGENHFFIEVNAEQADGITDTIKVGYAHDSGKQVLLNGKAIQSYKQLIDHYRIITLSAEDTALVQGAPEERRQFLNYSLCLDDPSSITQLRDYKQITAHRNALLSQIGAGMSITPSMLDQVAVWSEKLWSASRSIQVARLEYLNIIERRVKELLSQYFSYDENDIFTIKYQARGRYDEYSSFDTFWKSWMQQRFRQEQAFGRSLFGAHLDDFSLSLHQKKARIFASRGQQKLLTLLLKIAQIDHTNQSGEPGILLLDDFITDFDGERVRRCLELITSLKCQVFLTSPIETDIIAKHIDAQRIAL